MRHIHRPRAPARRRCSQPCSLEREELVRCRLVILFLTSTLAFVGRVPSRNTWLAVGYD